MKLGRLEGYFILLRILLRKRLPVVHNTKRGEACEYNHCIRRQSDTLVMGKGGNLLLDHLTEARLSHRDFLCKMLVIILIKLMILNLNLHEGV